MSPCLPRLTPEMVTRGTRSPIDREALIESAEIVESVRTGGEAELRRHATRLGDIAARDSLVLDRDDMREGFDRLEPGARRALERAAERIEAFAGVQLATLQDVTFEAPWGQAGHRWTPVESVGAYAPGGRHPLPSSVLMTVIPARVAGVSRIWCASPRPAEATLAAAWIAGADGMIAVGGAQAIAALSFGTVSPPCDMIVGPGNKWVTAAKKHLYGEVGIDMLAGPSEIVVIADEGASPRTIAADLLAQAEHDPSAIPVLITTSPGLADRVDGELAGQLSDLPTSDVASRAISNGYCVEVPDLAEAASMADRIAPEHLALHVSDPDSLMARLRHYGSIFVGPDSAEAFADYGAGPNHVLPTGGGARFQSGLSVSTFMRSPTWLRLERPDLLVEDTTLIARLEGLEAHARAAMARGGFPLQHDASL